MGIVRPIETLECPIAEIMKENKVLQSPKGEACLALTPVTSTTSDASPNP
jgi:hypothetical protein